MSLTLLCNTLRTLAVFFRHSPALTRCACCTADVFGSSAGSVGVGGSRTESTGSGGGGRGRIGELVAAVSEPAVDKFLRCSVEDLTMVRVCVRMRASVWLGVLIDVAIVLSRSGMGNGGVCNRCVAVILSVTAVDHCAVFHHGVHSRFI